MDVKSVSLPPFQTSQVRRTPHRYVRWGLPLTAAVLLFLFWAVRLPWRVAVAGPLDIPSPVTWDEIVASQSLEYYNCGDEFQCARLEVPMDYQRTDGQGRTFALAVVRLPAKVPVTDPRYGGAVLINPGK
ncbi:Proteinase [Penicillium coprophilum]|uniref:Proteinase n=1 Tax=Penicillium coprophilum TaxID=36646 RepID=UPI002392A8B2|nr:Proteinase [Penicillium coprophilum]KAJ5170073.1 Proteinase [Penicillium coprophilum]